MSSRFAQPTNSLDGPCGKLLELSYVTDSSPAGGLEAVPPEMRDVIQEGVIHELQTLRESLGFVRVNIEPVAVGRS